MNLQTKPRWVREEGGLRPFQRQTLEAIKGSAKLIEVEAPVGAGKKKES
jgi:superfamily II DNA or RNA helicase